MAEEHENVAPAPGPAPESSPAVPVTAGEAGPVVGSAEIELGDVLVGGEVRELLTDEAPRRNAPAIREALGIAQPMPRWRVGVDGLQLVTHRDASGLDHGEPGPGRKQVRGDRVVIAAPDAAAAREQFQRRFGVRSSVKPIKVTSA